MDTFSFKEIDAFNVEALMIDNKAIDKDDTQDNKDGVRCDNIRKNIRETLSSQPERHSSPDVETVVEDKTLDVNVRLGSPLDDVKHFKSTEDVMTSSKDEGPSISSHFETMTEDDDIDINNVSSFTSNEPDSTSSIQNIEHRRACGLKAEAPPGALGGKEGHQSGNRNSQNSSAENMHHDLSSLQSERLNTAPFEYRGKTDLSKVEPTVERDAERKREANTNASLLRPSTCTSSRSIRIEGSMSDSLKPSNFEFESCSQKRFTLIPESMGGIESWVNKEPPPASLETGVNARSDDTVSEKPDYGRETSGQLFVRNFDSEMNTIYSHMETKDVSLVKCLRTVARNSVTWKKRLSRLSERNIPKVILMRLTDTEIMHWTIECEPDKGQREPIKHLSSNKPQQLRVQEMTAADQDLNDTFRCQLCHLDFSTMQLVPDHPIESQSDEIHGMRTLTGGNPLRCDHCLKSFCERVCLPTHMKTHLDSDESKPFQCDYCPKNFSHNYNLQVHRRTHTGERPFKCDQCVKSFIDRPTLRKHMRIHTGERHFQCGHCQKSFSNSSGLHRHMNTHTGEKPFKCDSCDKRFNRKSNLQVHMKTHTDERPFTCQHCSSSFRDSGTFNRHMRIHTGEKPFKCNHCPKSFRDSGTLHKHIRTHTGEKPFNCDHCPMSFRQSYGLFRHMKSHTTDRAFKCGYCNKSFKHKPNLQIHMRIHTDERPFNCDQCSKSFKDNSSFHKHRQRHARDKSMLKASGRTHKLPKPFRCGHCDKSFNQNKSFLKHMKTHELEVPFACIDCDVTFNDSNALDEHMRSHDEGKSFTCGNCQKNFRDSFTLRRHMKIHTGEKSFKCDHCTKRFNQKSNMLVHMETHT